MCNNSLGINLDLSAITANIELDKNHLLFGEDQSRYIISINPENLEAITHLAKNSQIELYKIGQVINDKITIETNSLSIKELKDLNEEVFRKKFS